MNYQDEMELYEKYAAQDPVDELQREEQEEYRRYVRERKRRFQRRRRREIMRRKRLRRIRLTVVAILAAVIALIVIVRAITGNPVRASLTLELDSPLPEARAFLKRENSKAAIYFVTDMTQIDMSTAGETPIIVEVNGRQFESRLIITDPNAAGSSVSDSGTGAENAVETSGSEGTAGDDASNARNSAADGTGGADDASVQDTGSDDPDAADGTGVTDGAFDAQNRDGGADADGQDTADGQESDGTTENVPLRP